MKKRLFPALLPLALALSLIALFMASRWPLWEQSLMSDHSPAAWLSSAQLLALSFLAFRLGLDRTLKPILSMWLVISLAAMALDEQFMLHEQWKYGCSQWLAACSHAWVRELPMLSVAVVGSLTLFLLARSVADRLFRGMLVAAVGVGLSALLVDLSDVPVVFSLFEEVIEVSAEALFIGALLIAGNGNPSARDQVHSP